MSEQKLTRPATAKDKAAIQAFSDKVADFLQAEAIANGVQPDLIVNTLFSLASNMIVQVQPQSADVQAIKAFADNLAYFRNQRTAIQNAH
jgi:hypothetical protein